MARLLVGGPDCTYEDIVKILTDPSIQNVESDWIKLALSLNLLDMSKKLANDLRLDKMSFIAVLYSLLENWVSRNSENATLGQLLKSMPSDWNHVKDHLKKFIKKKCKCWEDLDDDSKNHVLQSKLTFLGVTHTFLSLKEKMANKVSFDAIMRENLTTDTIQKLFQNEAIKLDDNDIPQALSYHIDRTLTIKTKLRPAIFNFKCSDIFIIENIELYELSNLAHGEPTDLSGNQCEKLTTRFILFENEVDFQQILKIAKPLVPVHRIEKSKNDYHWKSTKGSSVLITTYLYDEFEEISEDVLVRQKLLTFDSRPFGYCGSPGMGKSSILARLANKTRELYLDRPVVFLQFSTLGEHLISEDTKQTLNDTQNVLGNLIAGNENSLGKKLVPEMLKNNRIFFEVFIDGYDEISSKNKTVTDIFLNCLFALKNIRIHMTSRLHTRQMLEELAGVVCFDLTHFNSKDQVNVIYKFWTDACKLDNQVGLAMVARKVLDSVVCKLDDIKSQETIGSIPLHCNMIGQVYRKEAKRYLSNPHEGFQIRNSTKSVFDLYTKFMKIKYEKVDIVDRKLIQIVHWKEALKKLSPDHPMTESFCQKLEVESRDADWNKIYKVGILEPRGNCNVFMHGTFAEYLLADFVNKHLVHNPNINPNTSSEFIFESIFSTKHPIKEDTLQGKQMLENLGKLSEPLMPLGLQIYNTLESEPEFTEEFFVNVLVSSLKGLDIRLTLKTMVERIEEFAIFDWNLDDVYGDVALTNSIDELTNPTVCFFLNKMLEKNVNECKKEPMTFSKFDLSLVQQNPTQHQKPSSLSRRLFSCSTMGFKYSIEMLINTCKENPHMNHLLFMGLQECRDLMILAAYNDDIDFFKYCCEIVRHIGQVEFDRIEYSKNRMGDLEFEHTPLHEAARRGNYRVAEHLINTYDKRILHMKGFPHICFVNSREDSSFIVKNKVQILKLLKTKMVPLDLRPLKHVPPLQISLDLFWQTSEIVDYKSEEVELKLANRFAMFATNYSRGLVRIIFDGFKTFIPDMDLAVLLETTVESILANIVSADSPWVAVIIRFFRYDCGSNEYSDAMWDYFLGCSDINQPTNYLRHYVFLVLLCFLSGFLVKNGSIRQENYGLNDRHFCKKHKVSFQKCLNFLNSTKNSDLEKFILQVSKNGIYLD